MTDRIHPPAFGEPMAAANPSHEARRLLALRRSTSPDLMADPGPGEETLAAILEIAARTPDHRKMVPFRFIVMTGKARAEAGEALALAALAEDPQADEARLAQERGRFLRAPLVVAVVSRVDAAHKTPVFEQELCCGAVCLNLLLAANAYGYASCWLTEWCAYSEGVARHFGLAANERFAGFVYIGSAAQPPRERQRPDMAAIVRYLR